MDTSECDVIIVGGGVSGLVCALVLARSGLSVKIIEDKPAIGGMYRTEFPFSTNPKLAAFTGAHRIGFVPPELQQHLGIKLPVTPRDPSMFVPTTTAGRYILAGAGNEGLRSAVGGVISDRDRQALEQMHGELDALTQDLSVAWTAPAAMAIEEISERYVRAPLRPAFVALCRGTFAEYAARFGIESGLLKGALAADALGSSFASWDSPGSGGPIIVRHAAMSLNGGGDAIPLGGLSALARAIADAAVAARVQLVTGATVTQIGVQGNTVTGVLLADGTELKCGAVVTSADPWRLRALVGAERFPVEYTRRVDSFVRPGGIAKLAVALSDLPKFTCLPEGGHHAATTFLLPGEDDAVRMLSRAFAEASAGKLPAERPIEVVFPTAADPSLRGDSEGHSASLLVPWAPYDLAGTTWAAEEERFSEGLLAILEQFAPGSRALVTSSVLYHPKKLESHFGVTRGHLGHVDDTMLFGDRLPATTPVSGLYTCGRGCSPAAGVFGVAGLNAARKVVSDFELALERTEVGMYG